MIERCKGNDCTYLFEAHHLNIRRASAMIQKYRVSKTDAPPAAREPSFYSTLRDRVWRHLGQNTGPTWLCVATFWTVLSAFTASWCMLLQSNEIIWCVCTGLLGAVVGAFGHNWVHQPRYRSWAVLSLDTVGLSSYDWVTEHNMLHHMYTNTEKDPHLNGTEPFLCTNPTTRRTLLHKMSAYAFPLLLSFGIFANYCTHASEILHGRKPLRPEKAIFLCQLGALLHAHGPYGGLLRMYIVFACTSVWYFTIALMNHNTNSSVDTSIREAARDWGERQLLSCSDFGTGLSFLASVPYLWLNYHTVHHLFPGIDMSHHPSIQNIVLQTAKEFNIQYETMPVYDALLEMVHNFANQPEFYLKQII